MFVFLPGSDCVFRRYTAGIPLHRQSPAHNQVLLHTNFSPVRGWHSHRAKLLHTSLLPPHAQPLHHPSTCLRGEIHKTIIISVIYCMINTNTILFWFQVPSEKDTLYLHLLFALKDQSVGTLESNFASTIFYAFTALQVQHDWFIM